MVSETSATCDAQKSIRSQLSSSPFRVHWGAPAQVKNSNADARRANVRGCATGVACLTKFLSRSTRASDCPFDMVKAGRLMKCLVRWGNMCIQVIVVYGVVSQKGSREAELMRQICEMVSEYPGQSLIGGDFNLPPQHLDAFQGLARLGYRELFSYYSDTRGVDLPPTCNFSTRHDTLIIPPVLLPSLTSAEVLVDSTIINHAPVRVHFEVHVEPIHELQWTLPATWADAFLDPGALQAAYERQTQLLERVHGQIITDLLNAGDLEDAFSQWAHLVEEAISQVWQYQFGHPLPASMRGRCKTSPVQFAPAAPSLHSARHGDFEPDNPPMTLVSKQRVRQTRRLEVLARTVKANAAGSCAQHFRVVRAQCEHQWQAILKAAGYGRSWRNWLLRNSGDVFVPALCPHHEYLCWCLEITRQDSNAYCKADAQSKSIARQLAKLNDINHRSLREHFRRVKDDSHPPITWVQVPAQSRATLLRSRSKATCIRLEQPFECVTNATASFGNAQVRVVSQQDNVVTVVCLGNALPPSGIFVQHKVAASVDELAEVFAEYWRPYWGRDDPVEASQLACDSQCQQLLDELSHDLPHIAIRWDDLPNVQRLIRSLPNGKCRGADGFSYEELKLLPPAAVEHLCLLFSRVTLEGGWHAQAMVSRVALLAKRSGANSMSDGRPITILGCLNRLYSRIMCDQIVPTLSSHFPSTIGCGLQGRGPNDLVLIIQNTLEKARNR